MNLRPVQPDDLPLFFAHQQDPAATHMAAFTSKDPTDRLAFDAHWARILADPAVLIRSIEVDQEVVGHIASFDQEDQREVTYWVGRKFWGQGLATQALSQFLEQERTRPLQARAAADNLGSIRVLEKCGFERVRTERGFANARGEEIEERVLRLV